MQQKCTKKGSQIPESHFSAERTRFELVVQNYPYVGLANRWFQPLTHLSSSTRRRFRSGLQRYEENRLLQLFLHFLFLLGHRMNGRALAFILWPVFSFFSPFFYHRMNAKAAPFILWLSPQGKAKNGIPCGRMPAGAGIKWGTLRVGGGIAVLREVAAARYVLIINGLLILIPPVWEMVGGLFG